MIKQAVYEEEKQTLPPPAPAIAWKPSVAPVPSATSPAPAPAPTPATVETQIPETEFTSIPGSNNLSAEQITLETTVQKLALGKAFEVQVEQVTEKKLIIRFVALTEKIARDTAILISKAPELKGYELTFKVKAKFKE